MGDRVTLNVGGQSFDTSLATITKDNHSSLAKIALHDLQHSPRRSIFIDRDSTHFRHILNFLRDGTCVLPASEDSQQELQKEAEYFQVQGLLELLAAARKDAHLQWHAQQAKVIERLRQEAGPALIRKVEHNLIEKVYQPGRDHAYLLSREVRAADIGIVAEEFDVPERSPAEFMSRYFEVIKYDLLNLGYTITGNDYCLSFPEYSGQRSLHLRGQVNAGSAAFGPMLTHTDQGLALRVQDRG